MKLRTTVAIAAAAMTGLLVLPQPAAAETTGAKLTITGGVLAITVPTATADLGSRANTGGGGTISGPLGQVQVDDGRTTATGWVASVISTAFTPLEGPAIPASAVSYDAGTITKLGTATYTANIQADLTGVVPAVTATGITGANSATWNPTIAIVVPGAMAPATYTATITHSVV